ncbi:MAG: oligosaccharide flippase family protein [Bacilli bacterium]|nr:oligosaccharide flippase family protein [Bacilli bacterium]
MNKTLKKFIQFSYGTWISLFIGLFTVGITTRFVAPESFGKFSILTTVLNFLIIFTIIGSDQAYVRFFYDTAVKNRIVLLKRCIFFPLAVLIPISLMILILHKPLTIFISGSADIILSIVIIFLLIFEVIHKYILLVIRMNQKANLYSLLSILFKISELLMILILFNIIKSDFYVLILSFAFSSLLIATLGLLFIKEDVFKMNHGISLAEVPNKKTIFNYSYPLMFTLILHWLFTSFDKIALNWYASANEVGIYASANKLVFLMTAVQAAFTVFWVPISQEHYSKNENDTDFYRKASNYISVVIFSLMVLIIASRNIFVLILGPNYISANNIMPFLVFGPALYTISETTVMGIYFKKKTKLNVVITFITSVFSITLNVLLIPLLGGIGAALATSFSYIVLLFLRTHISNKLYRVNFELNKMFFSIFLVMTYSLLVVYVLNQIFSVLFGVISILIIFYIYRLEVKEIFTGAKKIIFKNESR